MSLFAEKLDIARERLDVLFDRVQAEAPAAVVAAPLTGDMYVEEAP